MLTLALVGRPNVGKSSIFNKICRKSFAIVDDEEGTTRDRLIISSSWNDRPFKIIDTGGIGNNSKNVFYKDTFLQTSIAIKEADILILVTDVTTGITEEDAILARTLLAKNKITLLAVNKVDTANMSSYVPEFYKLGIQNVYSVSAAQNYNINLLIEKSFSFFDKNKNPTTISPKPSQDTKTINIALIGKPNVGKSTLINSLIEEERCIVSSIPGTTRDNVDVKFAYQNHIFNFIDTAGLQNKNKLRNSVSWLSIHRAEKAIKRSHICLLIIDISQGLSLFDKKILGILEREAKPCLVVFNKWDTLHKVRMEHYISDIKSLHQLLNNKLILCVSAKKRKNISLLLKEIEALYLKIQQIHSTHAINKVLISALQKHPPTVLNNKRLRIYYVTKINSSPLEFLLFINNSSLFQKSYVQYLKNVFSEQLNFKGVPITFKIKQKK